MKRLSGAYFLAIIIGIVALVMVKMNTDLFDGSTAQASAPAPQPVPPILSICKNCGAVQFCNWCGE